ncbi:MAG: hypothetical protein WC505_05995 [Patescibacteria group bacterium]
MKSALPGNHYCAKHQGNTSHYAEQNCDLCKAEAEAKHQRELAESYKNDAEVLRAGAWEMIQERTAMRAEMERLQAQYIDSMHQLGATRDAVVKAEAEIVRLKSLIPTPQPTQEVWREPEEPEPEICDECGFRPAKGNYRYDDNRTVLCPVCNDIPSPLDQLKAEVRELRQERNAFRDDVIALREGPCAGCRDLDSARAEAERLRAALARTSDEDEHGIFCAPPPGYERLVR